MNMIQLRDHLKMLSTLASPRFRTDETLCLPTPLQALSDCFAYMAQDVNDMPEFLRYHYCEHEEAAEEAVSNT